MKQKRPKNSKKCLFADEIIHIRDTFARREAMQVQRPVPCPSPGTLTGTLGSPDLHFHDAEIRVRSVPEDALISGSPAAVFITSKDVMVYLYPTETLLVLQYQEIILHAVGTDDPKSLYLQIESPDLAPLYPEDSSSAAHGMVELWLVPDVQQTSGKTFLLLSSQFLELTIFGSGRTHVFSIVEMRGHASRFRN